ncbi:MAG TPA: hypothetical protein VN831_28670 [Bradyrhizobium sp.]|nr:hypothetical protein [Bradyrhizobium sp.]
MVSKGNLFIVGTVLATFRLRRAAGNPCPFRQGNVPGPGLARQVGSDDFVLS